MSRGSSLARRWRSITLRNGLVSAAVVGVVTGVVMFGLAALAFFVFSVGDGVLELELADQAEAQLLNGVDPTSLNLPLAVQAGIQVGDDPSSGGAFWLVTDGNDVLLSSGVVVQSVIDADYGEASLAEFEGLSDSTQGGTKRVGGQEWIYLERQVTVDDGTTYDVIAASEGTLARSTFVRGTLLVVLPVILVISSVAGVISSFLSRRALRRVENIRAEVELISQQSLDRRVPTVDAADGVDKLAHTMNDMLGRLEASSTQQNQFLADASHELRSPVAGMLAQLEVAAAYPDRVDQTTLLPKLRDEAQRLQLLVEDLLFLSRSDSASGATSDPAYQPVDLAGLVAAEIEHHALMVPDGNLRTGRTCVCLVLGAPRDLQRALRNLVNNALRHCYRIVTIDCDNAGTHVVISVTDDGPGVSPEDAARIFDRFVRSDEARSRDVGGAGLGLAIAQEIARRHGGHIILAETLDPGATFQLHLPVVAGSTK